MYYMSKPRILFVDDERLILNSLKRITHKLDAEIITAESGSLALEILSKDPVDIIVSDMKMPKMNGIQLLEQVAKIAPETVRIILTGCDDMSMVLSAVNQGRIWAYNHKPWNNELLIVMLKEALELQIVLAERTLMRRTIDQYQQHSKAKFEGFIGDSLAMQFVYSCIKQCAGSNASVFITGSSGSGKEVAAKAIHNLSKRHKEAFIAINCAAIPSELMESEVFGHIKGAFSGAISNRDGAGTIANRGTLFLDEIGEMDINLQAKLLRFIQTGQFQKVGSSKIEQVDIRFICATNIEPYAAMAEKKLREDLFYRLNVISIFLPPLCERGNDRLQLAENFLSYYSKIENKAFLGFSSEGEKLINAHPWPGNVRQLQNVIHSAVVMSEGPLISYEILKQQLVTNFNSLSSPPIFQQKARVHNRKTQNGDTLMSVSQMSNEIMSLEKVERKAIEKAISVCQDNIVKAAGVLGVSPTTIYRKIQQWQTEPSE